MRGILVMLVGVAFIGIFLPQVSYASGHNVGNGRAGVNAVDADLQP